MTSTFLVPASDIGDIVTWSSSQSLKAHIRPKLKLSAPSWMELKGFFTEVANGNQVINY